MGLVGQAEHTVVMRQLHDAAQIGTDAVVGGVVHQHGLGVRIFPDGLFHRENTHAQRDTQSVVAFRVHIHRNGAAQHHGAHHAAVHVAGQDDLFAPLCHRQNHALHRAGGAAHHQKGVSRPKGLRGQNLRVPDYRDRVAQIVQRLHGVHVHAHTLLAQQIHQLRVSSPALVPGHVKGHHPHLAEAFQCLVDGSPLLIQMFHSLSPCLFVSQ